MPEFDIATLDEMVAFLDCAARPPPSMALTSDPVLENVTRYLEQGLTPVAAHSRGLERTRKLLQH